MVKQEFLEIVKEIKENEKEFDISPRELLNYFYCEKRTSGNVWFINNFLNENQLETIPNYVNGWIDGNILLKHKKKAITKIEIDPIQRIKLLPSSNNEPTIINKEAKLSEAITLMMLNNFSQLPILNGPRNVIGFISWETIGCALSNGIDTGLVKDYMNNTIVKLDYETPILDAISIVIENEFVIVTKKDNTISGIVTIADISSQFLVVTEPFLLLEQIENHIRQLLDNRFLIEDLKKICKNNEKDIEFIDDLTFGDYITIFGNQTNWDKLNLKIERQYFIKQLDKVRVIRNEIMHFDPEGITKEQRSDLTKMSKFLIELKKFLNKKNA